MKSRCDACLIQEVRMVRMVLHLPYTLVSATCVPLNRVGSQVQVYIDSYDPTGRKLALSMAPPGSSGDRAQQADTQQPQKAKRGRPPKGGAKAADTAALNEVQLQELARTPAQRWIQAVVQNVTPFGLFVRPANYDVTGMHLTDQLYWCWRLLGNSSACKVSANTAVSLLSFLLRCRQVWCAWVASRRSYWHY